jgi:hypothetical protein
MERLYQSHPHPKLERSSKELFGQRVDSYSENMHMSQ